MDEYSSLLDKCIVVLWMSASSLMDECIVVFWMSA